MTRIGPRMKLIALFAIFALPMLVAWAMVTWRVGIPDERTAHGRLDPGLPALASWPVDAATKQGVRDWVLVYACPESCDQEADRWWRLHRALGKNAERLSRVRIGGEAPALPGESITHWQGVVPSWASPGAAWISDPAGRVVLQYVAGIETALVLDDIEKLFKMNPEPERAEVRDEREPVVVVGDGESGDMAVEQSDMAIEQSGMTRGAEEVGHES